MELVFVPTPGMGHLLSAVEVSKLIIQRDRRISILILIIKVPMTSSILDSFVESQSRDNPYPTRLTFITLPPLSNCPDPSSFSFFQTLITLQKPLVKQAVTDRISKVGSPALAGFILDMFCTNIMEVADEFMVPSYIFFTSGASLLNFIFLFQKLEDDEGVDTVTKFNDPEIEFDVPGFVNQVNGKVVPVVFLEKEGGSSMIIDHARRFKKSNGIIVNTFTELESVGVEALFDQVSKNIIPAVYPVGPILELESKTRGGSQDESQDKILQWLDDQPSSSVVFLCFGSMGCFDADQVKEIANGLEKSGHRFLWSLRKPPPEGKVGMPTEHETFVDVLPDGFLERTAERGKMIGWAPQVSILSHQAVGGFVSHCGWNSTLESIWFGVPMATWPLYAEQQLNAFELVKELGLAVEIRMDYRRDWKTKKANFTVTAEEIENGVKKLMSLDEETKKKVREMSEKGKKALEEGGSSHMWLGRFIEDVFTNVASN
ncbi:anthocyanidin 3-O-glucosyltransferase 2-like [Spinacia oleracea]|uniref:Glycosyltransferase n=1 Tax=Spinacia oleracea TaxID=3562 RepID=A0A9R0I2W6_SPIOL|nr:anthocyanidin 3-O-glucosyltransferase 2-like [Spinacia oleracea]